jgi:hypothetical protein
VPEPGLRVVFLFLFILAKKFFFQNVTQYKRNTDTVSGGVTFIGCDGNLATIVARAGTDSFLVLVWHDGHSRLKKPAGK